MPSGAPRTVLRQRARGAEQARGSSGLRHGSWQAGDQLASLPNQCVERTPGKRGFSFSAFLAGAAHAQRWAMMKNLLKHARSVVAVVAFALSTSVGAELAMVSLESFLARSELVVIADVIGIDFQETRDAAGSATFSVIEVLRGSESLSTLSVSWGYEVHDQPIVKAGRYLLFLRAAEGNGFTGAVYGRSYWPLHYGTELRDTPCSAVVPYTYPLTMVDVGQTLPVRKATICLPEMIVEADAVCLESIRDVIRQARSGQDER
jgi:hypothetical protein